MSDQGLILVIEDDENDVLLMRRAFTRAGIVNPLVVLNTAEEAVSYFLGVGGYADRMKFPLPELVLLDLKLPGMDGSEFLRWIRNQPEIGRTRIVILTSSTLMSDIDRAYELGANSYLLKPTDFETFVEVSQCLGGYWLWMDCAPGTGQLTERRAFVDLKEVAGLFRPSDRV